MINDSRLDHDGPNPMSNDCSIALLAGPPGKPNYPRKKRIYYPGHVPNPPVTNELNSVVSVCIGVHNFRIAVELRIDNIVVVALEIGVYDVVIDVRSNYFQSIWSTIE